MLPITQAQFWRKWRSALQLHWAIMIMSVGCLPEPWNPI